MDMPFVNVCKEPRGIVEQQYQYAKSAYLVIPKSMGEVETTCASTGLHSGPNAINVVPWWNRDLCAWEISFGGAWTGADEEPIGHHLACEVRFDGTGTYSWYVPRHSVFQGTFGNSLRDLPITDTDLEKDIGGGELDGNISIQYTSWLSATNSEGVHWHQPNADWSALSACHPKALQLFNFDR